MSQAADRVLSPSPHYYGIMGRAAEIACGRGSRVGAEHLFLGMLHDGRWPVNVMSGLVDPGQVEAAAGQATNGSVPDSLIIGRPAAAQSCMPPATLTACQPAPLSALAALADLPPERQIT